MLGAQAGLCHARPRSNNCWAWWYSARPHR
jgi:hypothetical protein